jgi:MYXO-CTERM domain-containing protein
MFRALSMRMVRGWLLTAWVLAFTLTATWASAVGRVEWKTKNIKELSDGKAWRVEITIYLPKAPDTAHMPMKFEFDPVSYFERAMMDGDKLVERKVPLHGRQSLIESVDVGFLDAGSGKIENRTKFSFKVTRAHGYEAGEYRVTIRDGRSGNVVGTPTLVTFAGENEIIDRRSIVFTGGEGKKKKKKPAEEEGEGEGKEGGKSEGEEGAEPTAAANSMEGDEPSPDDEGAGDAPEPVEEKSGGCGCRVAAPDREGYSAGLLALAALALAFARRRSV